jgi:hypothetical protein
MKEQLRIAGLCRKIGLVVENIKSLLEGKTLTDKSFSFFSPEHNRKFTAEDVKLKIEKEPNNPNKLRLNLNGMDILEWFKLRYQDIQKQFGFSKNLETSRSRGIKM